MRSSVTPLAWRDLWRVAVIVGVFWLLAMHWELSERLAQWLQSYEHFQLDEMPLTLLVLSAGLVWFAFQRMHEIAELLQTNRHLTQRLMTAQEDERRLLAQELHDEVGQACTALRIEAAYIRKVLHSDLDAADAAAQRIDQSSLRMHSLARDMLRRLRPPSLDSMGLEESLHALCRSWEQHCHTPCHIHTRTPPNPLPDACSTTLYRVTQEALTNIAKHAKASHVWVSLDPLPDALTLTITDNGLGLPPHHATQGLGLIGMRERVASLKGRIHLEDAQPGLRIHVQIPLNEVHA